MTTAALLTLLVVVGVLAAMALSRVAPDILMMAAVTILVVGGVLTPVEALAGFGSPALWTVAALYVVALGLQETGAVQWLAKPLLGDAPGGRRARLLFPAAGLSAFLNNTTVVAMLIPAVQRWAQRVGVPPSKVLIPLSYAAILGGTCTLIGTSTNLVVDGMLRARGYPGFSIFDIAWVGVPLVLAGLVFLLLFADRLLPGRGGVIEQLARVREYAVEMEVEAGGPIAGRSIAKAGLRNLAHGYLAEVARGEHVLSAVDPETTILPGDRLTFIGAPDTAAELQRIQGLRSVSGGADKLDIQTHRRCLVEAVVSADFPGLGRTVKGLKFRTRYNAAILSVYRAGEEAERKVGDIRLQVGDTLLMSTDQAFVDQYRARRDFLLVSALNDSTPPDFHRAPRALAILALMVAAAALELVTMLEATFVAAGAMIMSRCVTMSRARTGVNYSVLIVIGASFALGAAVSGTGLARDAANIIVAGIDTPLFALAAIYLLTASFTELITNNAAAVLMFTIAMATAEQLGVDPMPFVVAVMFGASAAFLTPIGYQTNLMVMGPGGYRLMDYVRIGLPMSLLAFVVSVGIIPLVWNF